MRSGLGIRPELFAPVFDQRPDLGFLEAHSENYFGESIARATLLELREHYPISLHGVGLSLGRADQLSAAHLAELKSLVDQVDPLFVSEHLAWSAYSHRHVPDLLPLPLTEGALGVMCQHIDQMQNALGRQILLENPSNYLVFDRLQIPEPEFLNTLAERTGCGLLIDVNNIHVSASNVGRNATAYVEALNTDFIGQYHLAGYTEVNREIDGVMESVLIDTHNDTVFDPVWELFERTLAKHGARPTLFEWDSDFPEFSVMLGECAKADKLLAQAVPGALNNAPQIFDSKPVVDPQLGELQTQFLDSIFKLQPAQTDISKAHQRRLHVYQNNVFGATQDYLAQVYPATRGVLGADFFKQYAQRHIQKLAPNNGNIHFYGVGFDSGIAEFEALQEMVYLADLMAYEWALHNAYYAANSDSIDPASVAQDELLTMLVAFNNTTTLIQSQYPIYEIHRQSLPEYQGEVAINLNQSQDSLLVYKTGHDVVTRVLDDQETAFLKEIQKSENLLQAIEALQGSILPETLSATLGLMFEARLLRATPVAVDKVADEIFVLTA